MIGDVDTSRNTETSSPLDHDFTRRLEASLQNADEERRRRALFRRARLVLPYFLLLAPIIAWRLTVVSPGTAHVAIDALAWLTFLVDVGIHVDAVLLGFLNLQTLPSAIGVLLLVLVPAWLLVEPRDRG